MTGTVLRHVQVADSLTDVRVEGPVITDVAPHVDSRAGDEVIDGRGGALIPGLHDHHIHLLAAAAAEGSVRVGPPDVRSETEFVATLRRSAAEIPVGAWVRGIGYHESVAGPIERRHLDAIVADRCLRIQDRSGALWILNTRALDALGIDSETGRLFGSDEWLGPMIVNRAPPQLAPIGARLAAYGVTGVTDATPSGDVGAIELLARAVTERTLPQSVVVTGALALAAAPSIVGIGWGPVKFVIADHALPSLDEVRGAIVVAHLHRRPIAIHCVTAVALALALAAWGDADAHPGDRIEHGAVITPDGAVRIAELGLTVVTQPGFIETRGDQYLSDVDDQDRPHLYRCRTLLAAGIEVGGSTDAPFGDLDPWRAINSAIERRTESGVVIGSGERLSRRRGLDLFLTSPDRPGGPTRRISPGADADLCLLDDTLDAVLAAPSSDHVVGTITRGHVAYRR